MLSWWKKRQQKKLKQQQKVKQKKIQDAQRRKDEGRARVRGLHYSDLENKEIGKSDAIVIGKSKEAQLNHQGPAQREMYEQMIQGNTALDVPPIRLRCESGKCVTVNQKQSTALMLHQVEDHTSSKTTRTFDKSNQVSYVEAFNSPRGVSKSQRAEHTFMETSQLLEKQNTQFDIENKPARGTLCTNRGRAMENKIMKDKDTIQFDNTRKHRLANAPMVSQIQITGISVCKLRRMKSNDTDAIVNNIAAIFEKTVSIFQEDHEQGMRFSPVIHKKNGITGIGLAENSEPTNASMIEIARGDQEQQTSEIEDRPRSGYSDSDLDTIVAPFINETPLSENVNRTLIVESGFTRGDESVIAQYREQAKKDREYRSREMGEQMMFEDTGLDFDSYPHQQDGTIELYTNINMGLTGEDDKRSNVELGNMLFNQEHERLLLDDHQERNGLDDNEQQTDRQGDNIQLDLGAIDAIIQQDIEKHNTKNYNVIETSFSFRKENAETIEETPPQGMVSLTHSGIDLANADYTARYGGMTTTSAPEADQIFGEETARLDLEAISHLIDEDIKRRNAEIYSEKDNFIRNIDDPIGATLNNIEDYSKTMEGTQPQAVALLKQLNNEIISTRNEFMEILSEGKFEQMNPREGFYHLDCVGLNQEDIERQNTIITGKTAGEIDVVDTSFNAIFEENPTQQMALLTPLETKSVSADAGTATRSETMLVTSASEAKHVIFGEGNFQLDLGAISNLIDEDIKKRIAEIHSEKDNFFGTDNSRRIEDLTFTSRSKIEDMGLEDSAFYLNVKEHDHLIEDDVERQEEKNQTKRDTIGVETDNVVGINPKAHSTTSEEKQPQRLALSKELDNQSIHTIREYTKRKEVDKSIEAIISKPENYSNIREQAQAMSVLKHLNSQSTNSVRGYRIAIGDNVLSIPEVNVEPSTTELIDQEGQCSIEETNRALAIVLGFDPDEKSNTESEDKLYEEKEHNMYEQEYNLYEVEDNKLYEEEEDKLYEKEEDNLYEKEEDKLYEEEEDKQYKEHVETKEPVLFEIDEQILNEFHEQLVTTAVPEPIIQELVEYHKNLYILRYHKHMSESCIQRSGLQESHPQTDKCLCKKKSLPAKLKDLRKGKLNKLFAEQFKTQKPHKIVQEYDKFKEIRDKILMEYKEKTKDCELNASIQEKQARAKHDSIIKSAKERLQIVQQKIQQNPKQREHAQMADQLKDHIRKLYIIKRKIRRTPEILALQRSMKASLESARNGHNWRLFVLWKEHYSIKEPVHRKESAVLWKEHHSIKEPVHREKPCHCPKDMQSNRHVLGKTPKCRKMLQKNSIGEKLESRKPIDQRHNVSLDEYDGADLMKTRTKGCNTMGEDFEIGVNKMTAKIKQGMTEQLWGNRTSVIEISRKESKSQTGMDQRKGKVVLSPSGVKGKQTGEKRQRFEGSCGIAVKDTGVQGSNIVGQHMLYKDSNNMIDTMGNNHIYSERRGKHGESEKKESQVENNASELKKQMDNVIYEFKQQLVRSGVPEQIIQNLLILHETLNVEKYRYQMMRYGEREAQNEYDRHRLRLQEVIYNASEMYQFSIPKEVVQKAQQELLDIEREEIDRRKIALASISKASKDYSKNVQNIRQRNITPLNVLFTKQLATNQPEAIINENAKYEKYCMEETKKLNEALVKINKQGHEACEIYENKIQSLKQQLKVAKGNNCQQPTQHESGRLADQLTKAIGNLKAKEKDRKNKTRISKRDLNRVHYKRLDLARMKNNRQTNRSWKEHYQIKEEELKLEQVLLRSDPREVIPLAEYKQALVTDIKLAETMIRLTGAQENQNEKPEQRTSPQCIVNQSTYKVPHNESALTFYKKHRKRRAGDSPNMDELQLKCDNKAKIKKKTLKNDTVAGEDLSEHNGQQGKVEQVKTRNREKRSKRQVKRKGDRKREVSDTNISELARRIVACRGNDRKRNMAVTAQTMTTRASTRATTKASYQYNQQLINKKKEANPQNLEYQGTPTYGWKSDKSKDAIYQSENLKKADEKKMAFQERHRELQCKETEKKQKEERINTERRNEKERNDAGNKKEERRRADEKKQVDQGKVGIGKQDNQSQTWGEVVAEYEKKYC